MIKIINNCDRVINITSDLKLAPGKFIRTELVPDSRILQLAQMNVITIEEINPEKEEKVTELNCTPGDLRRKQILDNIRAGRVEPSIPLHNVILPKRENNIQNTLNTTKTENDNNKYSTVKRRRK